MIARVLKAIPLGLLVAISGLVTSFFRMNSKKKYIFGDSKRGEIKRARNGGRTLADARYR